MMSGFPVLHNVAKHRVHKDSSLFRNSSKKERYSFTITDEERYVTHDLS